MKITLRTITNTENGKVNLPKQFGEAVRPDLIKRAVLAIQSHKRQAYGAFPEAGKRYSAQVSKRRRKYRGIYGRGGSRTPRKVLNSRGSQFYFVGAFAPQTVGGRRAHPPKAEKSWVQKINVKEKRKAIRSALAATVNADIVKNRGHKVPDTYPFVVESSIEDVKTTKELQNIFIALGFEDELKRCQDRKIRAGKGKMRGRKYVSKKGPLLVVSKKCDVLKAASNLPGIDIVTVESINTEVLAPGTHPGRATLFSSSALERMEVEKLFSNEKKVTSKQSSAKKA